MTTLRYTLTLLSDGEPATGFGLETVDALVPRDHHGEPVVPSSHLKGLLRERVESLASVLGERCDALVEALFGAPGDEGDDGVRGVAHIGPARLAAGQAAVRTIARTKIGALGTASGMTLRTVEALRATTSFQGTVRVDAPAGGEADLALRVALLSLESIGGNRTRGAGLCRIDIEEEARSPGEILRTLAKATPAVAEPAPAAPPITAFDEAVVWYRLSFVAEEPVCCPETPPAGSNVLRGGPAIPASAVQGALLTRLSEGDDALAARCFGSASFRAWPLLPCAPDGVETSPIAVRVDLAHRMSKLPGADHEHHFADVAIQPVLLAEHGGGSPLKASDGFLLRDANGVVRLWRSHDVPRVFAAHAVIPDARGRRARNLFTVEALAPMRFSGYLALPRGAAMALKASLQRDPWVVFGRSQGVRGGGRLSIVREEPDWAAWTLPDAMTHRVFVVQSPLVIPDAWEVGRAEEALAKLVEEAGWGRVIVDDHHGARRVARSMALCGVRFGWNRRGLGDRVGGHNRLRARRVVLPGSVFVLEVALDAQTLGERLARGIGEGREEGYGAVIPHPGIASTLVRVEVLPTQVTSGVGGKDALALYRAVVSDPPSPSQISELLRRAEGSVEGARKYIEEQRKRHARYASVWDEINIWLKDQPDAKQAQVVAALRTLHDLLINARDGARSERG
jgi:CRISPR/Cas system CSM-associated protein Csm3 (group 7 of RAMP superfamily)